MVVRFLQKRREQKMSEQSFNHGFIVIGRHGWKERVLSFNIFLAGCSLAFLSFLAISLTITQLKEVKHKISNEPF